MSKRVIGKTHIGERHERRPNGDIYVYERVTAYNPETQKTYTVSQKLKGKIVAGTDEIVPTRPKKPKGKGKSMNIKRMHTGLTDILEWIGKSSGIDKDLHNSFSAGDAAKIISIARYWLASNGSTLPRMESWQVMHSLPYCSPITEDVYGDLFKSLGHDEAGIQYYFRGRADRLDKSPVLAFDTTTISAYSKNQIEALQGFNKDRDGLNTIKLLTIYSVKDQEPIAFAKQPGNIPDVISIKNTLTQLKYLDLKKPVVVTDNGCYSQNNMCEFVSQNMKFLILADSDLTWIRETIDSLSQSIRSMSNTCPFDPAICGATVSRQHEFKRVRQRKHNGKLPGTEEIFTRPLYAHIFHSYDNIAKKEVLFRQDLLELKSQLEAGMDLNQFTKTAQNKIKKYLLLSRAGRGGQLKVGFNDQAIDIAKKYFGYFALVSNQSMDTFTALENYRLRAKIERVFSDWKGAFDGARPRTWYPDNLRGRQFVQFIALGYHCFLMKKINEVKAKLAKQSPEKNKSIISLENKLKKWLDQRSLAQILDWFDCIETTSIETPMGKYRWSTESVARDKLLLKYLGVENK